MFKANYNIKYHLKYDVSIKKKLKVDTKLNETERLLYQENMVRTLLPITDLLLFRNTLAPSPSSQIVGLHVSPLKCEILAESYEILTKVTCHLQ